MGSRTHGFPRTARLVAAPRQDGPGPVRMGCPPRNRLRGRRCGREPALHRDPARIARRRLGARFIPRRHSRGAGSLGAWHRARFRASRSSRPAAVRGRSDPRRHARPSPGRRVTRTPRSAADRMERGNECGQHRTAMHPDPPCCRGRCPTRCAYPPDRPVQARPPSASLTAGSKCEVLDLGIAPQTM